MPRYTTVVSHLSEAELEQHYRTVPDPVERRRYHLIWLVVRGYSLKAVAQVVGLNYDYAKDLLKAYNQGGQQLSRISAKSVTVAVTRHYCPRSSKSNCVNALKHRRMMGACGRAPKSLSGSPNRLGGNRVGLNGDGSISNAWGLAGNVPVEATSNVIQRLKRRSTWNWRSV